MRNNDNDKVEELSDDQIQSVSAAGAPRKGVVACSSPSGDLRRGREFRPAPPLMVI